MGPSAQARGPVAAGRGSCDGADGVHPGHQLPGAKLAEGCRDFTSPRPRGDWDGRG